MPAFHATIGVWSIGITFLCLLFFRTGLAKLKMLFWFLGGLALTCLSYLAQHLETSAALRGLAAPTRDYLAEFIDSYGGHFLGIKLGSTGLWLTVALTGLAFLLWRQRDREKEQGFFYLFMALSGGLSVLGYAFQASFYEHLPYSINIFMFSRLFLLVQVGMAPMVLARLYAEKESWLSQLAFTIIIFVLMVVSTQRSLLLPFLKTYWFAPDALINFLCLMLGALVMAVNSIHKFSNKSWSKIMAATSVTLCLVWMVSAIPNSLMTTRATGRDWRMDYTTDEVLRAASQGSGFIAADSQTSLKLLQLKTKRPLLFNKGLDEVYIAPQAGPLMERMMKDIFGWKWTEKLNNGSIMDHMEKMSLEDWRQIRTEYGLTDIIGGPYTRLKLPLIKANSRFQLFHIPK